MPKGKTVQQIADEMGLNQKQKMLVAEVVANPARTAKDIMMSAGYTEQTSLKAQSQVLGNPRIKSAIAEYIRSNAYDERMQRVYDDILGGEDKRLALDAVKQLHKIKGDEAPTRHLSAHIDYKIEEDQ